MNTAGDSEVSVTSLRRSSLLQILVEGRQGPGEGRNLLVRMIVTCRYLPPPDCARRRRALKSNPHNEEVEDCGADS